MDTVVVSHQGTDPEKMFVGHVFLPGFVSSYLSTPLLEDLDFVLEPLDPDLFPDVSSDVQVHSGFKKAHSDSASAVLDAVQNTINSTGTSSVAVVGHSLGAAIALIDTLFLSMNLDPNIRIRHIGYGLPRVRISTFSRVSRHSNTSILDR
jgi:predicted lipase